MRVKIDALDTLSFGLGKPSVWGEDTFGAGMFPPYPSVVRGAVRTISLSENGNFDVANTADDPTMAYKLTAYALLINGEPHFPVPADYVLGNDGKSLMPCELQSNDGLSSLETPYQLWVNTDGKIASAEKRYISLESIQSYLKAEIITDSILLADYITLESRIGIYKGRETKTVRQGMLYRSPLTRTENENGEKLSIIAHIDGAEKVDGIVRFGSKGKIAHVSKYDGNVSPDGMIDKNEQFKIYLATPAIFKDGCLPQLPLRAKLLTAAVYGYESAGGFDIKKKRPKPMHRAVRAGSVYYYELAENTQENRDAVLALHGKSISDYSRDDGFGICYIGKIKED